MRLLGFTLLSLVWLPAAIVLFALLRSGMVPPDLQTWLSLAPAIPGGVPLAFACRAIRRRGRRRAALITFLVLGPVTVLLSLGGGLLGPIGVIVYAAVPSLPAWGFYAYIRWRESRPGPERRPEDGPESDSGDGARRKPGDG